MAAMGGLLIHGMHYPDLQPSYYLPCVGRVVRWTPLTWDVDVHLALAGSHARTKDITPTNTNQRTRE